MITTMTFPVTRPQQALSMSAQQTTSQQLDIGSILNLMLPVMIVTAMMGMMGKKMKPEKKELTAGVKTKS